MSIDAIRFRMEGELCVLQVLETTYKSGTLYHYEERSTASWRDAKAEDLLQVAKHTADYTALAKQVEQLKLTVSEFRESGFNPQEFVQP